MAVGSIEYFRRATRLLVCVEEVDAGWAFGIVVGLE
jgi:hypothetical protein